MTLQSFDSLESGFVKGLHLDEEKQLSLGGCKYKSDIEDLQYNPDTAVGILPIVGSLTYEDSWCWWCDTTSYKSILDNAQTMIEAGAKTLVLDVDSGGGLAYGMMETASLLRKMADENDVHLISYNDGLAASAAYGISSVAHEYIVNPDAETGSIGVVVSLTNYSGYYAKNGIKQTFITAGEGKVPYAEDGEFTQEFLDDIQSKVDKLYDRFSSHVAQYRGMTQDAVKSLGAKVYTSDEALANGLVDKIMTREEFFTYLAEVSSDKGKQTNMLSNYFNKSKPKDKEMSNEDLQVALEAAKVEWESEMSAQLESKIAEMTSEFTSKLEAKQSELEVALQALAAVETEKKEAKVSTRKAQLAAVLGDKEAESAAVQYAELSDDMFDFTVGMLKKAQSLSEQSELMQESGDDGVAMEEEKPSLSYAEKVKAAQQKRIAKNK